MTNASPLKILSKWHYSLLRECYRWCNKYIDWKVQRSNLALRIRYRQQLTHNFKKKVYIHQHGYEWFYTSSISGSLSYQLVDSAQAADLIVFITIVDEALALKGKKILILCREPKDYSSLYQNTLSSNFFLYNEVTVVSHLESPKYFINSDQDFTFIRSFFYPHYHHWATKTDLEKLDLSKRNKKIFSLTSGLSGIAGNTSRREFIRTLSSLNKDFDLYGRFSRDTFSLENYRGMCGYKYKLLGRYRYNLVIENSPTELGYITEKIFDALICGCMPVYHGTRKIFEIIPEKWFYYLPNLDLTEIEKLNRFLKTDAYLEVSNHRKEIAQFIDQRYSFYSMVERFISGQSIQLLAFNSEDSQRIK
jgi:hypothetical protein